TNNRRGLLPRTNKGRAIAVLGGGMLSILILVGGTVGQELGSSTTRPTGSAARATTGPSNSMIAEGVAADGAVRLTVNKTTVVTTSRPYKQVSIGQPEIADINMIGPNNILITAKKAGS